MAASNDRRLRPRLHGSTAGARAIALGVAADNLAATFTGPLARSLALVAIVIGGLMFMFGEGGAKRQISGIVFGGGLALFAAQFLAWLF
jgi:type IV secretory pathway VirB2 component (pilin)